MTSRHDAIDREVRAERLAAVRELRVVSCREAGDICAEIGLTHLDAGWWRLQCRRGYRHLSAGRERYMEFETFMSVIQRIIAKAIVPEDERDAMIERFARNAVNHQSRQQSAA